MRISDWSSDVCSSDLRDLRAHHPVRMLDRLLRRDAGELGQRRFAKRAGGRGQAQLAYVLRRIAAATVRWQALEDRLVFGIERQQRDGKSTRLNCSHDCATRLPSAARKNKIDTIVN